MAGWAELPAELIMAVIESEPFELLPLHRLRRLAGVCKHWRNTIIRRVNLGPAVLYSLPTERIGVCGEDFARESREERASRLWQIAMTQLRYRVRDWLRTPAIYSSYELSMAHKYRPEEDDDGVCGKLCPGCAGAYRGDASDNCGHRLCLGPCVACHTKVSGLSSQLYLTENDRENAIMEANNVAIETWLALKNCEPWMNHRWEMAGGKGPFVVVTNAKLKKKAVNKSWYLDVDGRRFKCRCASSANAALYDPSAGAGL